IAARLIVIDATRYWRPPVDSLLLPKEPPPLLPEEPFTAGARSPDRRRRAACRHAGAALVDDHRPRGWLVIDRAALLLSDDGRRGLTVNVTAHADCGAAAAVNRHARATRALTHTRTAGALRLAPRRRRAAGHILFRSGAALALPAAALLAHAGATLLA